MGKTDNRAVPQPKPNETTSRPRMSSTSGIQKSHHGSPPPPHASLAQRRLKPLCTRNPSLALKLSQTQLTIAPIVHLETGLPAPGFPATLLSFFLLTEPQLDSMATYYSQTPQTHDPHLSNQYPATMDWAHQFLDTSEELPEDCRLSALERLKVKMRMFARFVGMRGAQTPMWEYERQVQILGNKARWAVREEERREEEMGRKMYSGPTRLL